MADPKQGPSKKNEGNKEDPLSRIKKHEKIEDFTRYAKNNTSDVVSYVVLIIGIIFMFFNPWIGGILLGLIFGIYFSKDIIYFFSHLKEFIDEQGLGRSLVIGAVFVGIFILSPALYIAAAIGVGAKEIVLSFQKK